MSEPSATAALPALRAAVADLEAERQVRRRGHRRASSESGTQVTARQSSVPPPPDPVQDDAEPDPRDVARTIVLKQLTSSPKTRVELARVLARRGCDPQVAEEVLERLAQVGLIDDAAYAATVIESKRQGKGLAKRALRHELAKRGVDGPVIEEALDGIDEAEERATARALVDRRLRALHGLDVTVQTRRLAGMLARKGYGSSLSYAVIREALSEAPEHQRD